MITIKDKCTCGWLLPDIDWAHEILINCPKCTACIVYGLTQRGKEVLRRLKKQQCGVDQNIKKIFK